MRDHTKLAKNENPLSVSGALIALENQGFIRPYLFYAIKTSKALVISY